MRSASSCREITILLVDDDAGFRGGLAAVFEDDGHEVLSYGSPREIPVNGKLSSVDVLISDYEMPGESGFSFVDRFHGKHPEVPIILVTAHHTGVVTAEAARRPFLKVVWKPLQYDDVHDLLHRLTASESPASK